MMMMLMMTITYTHCTYNFLNVDDFHAASVHILRETSLPYSCVIFVAISPSTTWNDMENQGHLQEFFSNHMGIQEVSIGARDPRSKEWFYALNCYSGNTQHA